ncbi:cytidine deaminase [Mucor circinelloides 1006PhL]|uniref:Cytidine deaminase n=1 Tax=Mucor circinelloides f. circinelloides (strain 1006PhL) TaxID=1220926 RepID=S2JZ40_MUCC1|nr:cytidine deaminase [Mucor circinelloides 1006PhL]
MTSGTLSKEEQKELFNLALTARETSYSPYSKFRVGAALMATDGTLFKGCNVENASYGAAICAERTAFVKAVSEGHLKFRALAVSTDQDDFISPCGICRQFISEFVSKDMPVFFLNKHGDHREYKFEQLLPFAFDYDSSKEYLQK